MLVKGPAFSRKLFIPFHFPCGMHALVTPIPYNASDSRALRDADGTMMATTN